MDRTSTVWGLTGTGRSASITILLEEEAWVDHVKYGNEAGKGRRA